MSSLRDVPAPAKVNLFLHVTGRRPDGYHLLQTVFRFIDLQDTLHFTARADGRVVRATDLPGVPHDTDLTVRAARALQQATGSTRGVDIELEKRIPAGGGLGGGSSDAATVLLALNRLWNTGLTRAQLMRIALPLGADVPVFVYGHNAFAEGVGEELHALNLPRRWYVIIQPDASVPTADIFRAPELTRDSPPVKIADFSAGTNYSTCGAAEEDTKFESTTFDRTKFDGTTFRNDLEAVAFARFPEVARIAGLVDQALAEAVDVKSSLNEGSVNTCSVNTGSKAQASKLCVRMSGSGACLFVECGSRQQADWAASEIAAKIASQPSGLAPVRASGVYAGLDAHPLLDWATA